MNTVQAVYRYADVLRASVSSASGDHRLVTKRRRLLSPFFIGETLTDVLSKLEAGIDADAAGVKETLDLLSKIPNLELDNTDRNRTSPLPLPAISFEIRMVGSSMNCALP